MSNTPHSFSSHNPKNSSAILECLGESLPKDSKSVSESPTSDSETPSGGVYLHRDKNQIARSANFEGVALGERKSYERIARGEGATSQFKPLPLNKKENIESEEVNQILEVEKKDSQAKDSESETQTESARALDSEKLEFTTDSESKMATRADSQSIDCHEAAASRK